MPSSSRVLPLLIVGHFFLAPAASSASPVAEFQARLAQTYWNLQAVEGLVRAFEIGSDLQPTPDALAAHLTLLSENVAALDALAAARLTNEQKRLVADGLKGVAGRLKDQTVLAVNRGLGAAASTFAQLESSCRSAIRLL